VACFRAELHSSYARPAPKPAPTKAGHARRLNRRTEKTTPKPTPSVDLTMRFETQRSHYTTNQYQSPCNRAAREHAAGVIGARCLPKGGELGMGGL
jgi:hypothetical protein